MTLTIEPTIDEVAWDRTELAPQTPPPEQQAAALPRSWGVRVFLAVAAVRILFATVSLTSSWRISYDEPAQLAIARFLGGGYRWKLFHAPAYQPGLGILLAPVAALGVGPETLFRTAVMVNCVLAGLASVVLAAIGRQLGIRPAVAATGAGLVASFPSMIALSSHAWADPAISLTFLCVLWGCLRFRAHNRGTAAAGAVGAAVLGYLAHARMLPCLVITAIMLSALAARRHRWLVAGGVTAAATAGALAVTQLSGAVRSALWQSPLDTNSVGATLERVADVRSIARAAIGQGWYQSVATLGVAVIGAAVLVAAVAGTRPNTLRVRRGDAFVIGALILPMIATSVVFMSGRTVLASSAVYGRYIDDVIWPVTLIGLAEAWQRRAGVRGFLLACLMLPLMTIAVLTTLVRTILVEDMRERWVGEMVNGIAALTPNERPDVLFATLVAVSALGLLTAAALGTRRRPALAPALLAAVLLLGGANLYALRTRPTTTDLVRPISAVDRIVPSGEEIGYRFTYRGGFRKPDQIARLAQNYQYLLPGHEFVLVDDFDELPKYVLSTPDDPKMLETATVIWSNPLLPHVLWEVHS